MGLPISPTKIYGKRNLYKQIMSDGPVSPLVGWQGYFHNTDPTVLHPNALTFPSKNCFIPNKDKIVPRLGKTLLGQPFATEDVDIGFDSFSSKETNTGNITEGTPLEFEAHPNAYNASVAIDVNHFLNFWARESDGHGVCQVFEVDLTTKEVTAKGTPFEFYAGQVFFNSCYMVNANHFINFWRGALANGFTQVFRVDLLTWVITASGAPLNFEADINSHNSCFVVDSGATLAHYINFWGGGAAGVTGYAQVFEVTISTMAVTAVGAPFVYDAAVAGGGAYNCVRQVTAGVNAKYINFWASNLNVGKVQCFNIDGAYAVTAVGAALTFDATQGRFNSASIITPSASKYINFWEGAGNVGKAALFDVNMGTFAVTLAGGSTITFDAALGIYNSCVYMDGDHFMNFWQGASNKLYAQVFAVVSGTNTIEPLGTPLNFDTRSSSIFNAAVRVALGFSGEQMVINFWGGTKVDSSTDGNAAVFSSVIDLITETFSHACVGDNRILFVSISIKDTRGGSPVTGVSYNGVPLTSLDFVSPGTDRTAYLYYLVGPAAGIHDVVVSTAGVDRYLVAAATSYFGAKQEAPTIFSHQGPSSVLTRSISETPTQDNSWIAEFFLTEDNAYAGTLTPAAPLVFRGGSTSFKMGDTNGPITPPALTTLSITLGTLAVSVAFAVAFAPKGGTPAVKNWDIVGHKKRFTNDGGYTMEVRVTRTGDAAFRDMLEVLLANPLTGIKEWYQITESANPLPVGVGERYYMDSFFDTNLNPAISRRNSRLVWATGIKTIFSWAGGVNPITAVVPGVSITGEVGKSWISQGFPVFTAIPGQIIYIVVKGKKYLVTSGWDTDTLLLSDTEGISVGDIATAWIAPAGSSIVMQDTIDLPSSYPAFDYCRQNKNYMFYGSFSSRQLFMSNNFNRPPRETISPGSSFVYQDDLTLPPTPDFSGSGVVVYTVTIDSIGSPNTFHWSYTYNGVTTPGAGGISTQITAGVKQVLSSPVGDIGIIFVAGTGHVLGDAWTIKASPSVGDANSLGDSSTPPAWANFFYDLPRIPGQGYIFFLPANFWAMEPQESDMYVNDQYGQWSTITTQIAADLQSETISFDPLKQLSAAKVIFPYMISHMENEIVFVTENKHLEFIARKKFLELPQMDYLSQPVAKDFEAASFVGGSMEYLNKRLHITSPAESVMLVYDNQAGDKYWQPPQVYAENGILSIVENTLISHSNLRNQTFNLFTGKSDAGSAFTVVMRTPYLSFGDRWRMKNSNKSFLEGYIGGLPPLFFRAIQGIGGCAGVFEHEVKPVVCAGSSIAPLGEGSLGSHPNGSDLPDESLNHFNEIFPKYNPILQYYFLAFELSCSTKNHTYEVLSMGVNELVSNTGNSALIPEEQISQT